MKKVYNKELECQMLEAETPLEAVEQLEGFFECDMWYAQHAEWKTEKDMIKYLHDMFKICKDLIKKIKKVRK